MKTFIIYLLIAIFTFGVSVALLYFVQPDPAKQEREFMLVMWALATGIILLIRQAINIEKDL